MPQTQVHPHTAQLANTPG